MVDDDCAFAQALNVTRVMARQENRGVILLIKRANRLANLLFGDDSKVRRELGLEWRPLEETLSDTVRWLASAGHIKPWWATRLK